MAEAVCKICNNDLLVGPVSDDDDDDEPAGPSSSAANNIPDDLLFPCGCHYHWDCALEQATHIATHLTCPSCHAHLVSNTPGPSVTNPIFHTPQSTTAILCRYEGEKDVEPQFDILPDLMEEAYLEAHPTELRNRRFLTMCAEGDVDGAVMLLEDAAAEGGGDEVRGVVLSRDALAGGKSALQIALERKQEAAVWLLLYLASPRMPTEAFPEEVIAEAANRGLDRMPGGGEDIVSVRDAEGRSAEDYARALAPVWDRLVQAGVLRL